MNRHRYNTKEQLENNQSIDSDHGWDVLFYGGTKNQKLCDFAERIIDGDKLTIRKAHSGLTVHYFIKDGRLNVVRDLTTLYDKYRSNIGYQYSKDTHENIDKYYIMWVLESILLKELKKGKWEKKTSSISQGLTDRELADAMGTYENSNYYEEEAGLTID